MIISLLVTIPKKNSVDYFVHCYCPLKKKATIKLLVIIFPYKSIDYSLLITIPHKK